MTSLLALSGGHGDRPAQLASFGAYSRRGGVEHAIAKAPVVVVAAATLRQPARQLDTVAIDRHSASFDPKLARQAAQGGLGLVAGWVGVVLGDVQLVDRDAADLVTVRPEW